MLRGGGGGKPLAGPVAGRLTLVKLLAGRGKVEAPPQLGCCKDNMANPPNPIQENTSIHKHFLLPSFAGKKKKHCLTFIFCEPQLELKFVATVVTSGCVKCLKTRVFLHNM